MKIILSRKGVDSSSTCMTENGKFQLPTSPILPDGTLLSFPIPDSRNACTYDELVYEGMTYEEIIRQLKPSFPLDVHCHNDPDIRAEILERSVEWRPAFGQADAALTHLYNEGVGEGDIFLFFGRFRQTEWFNGSLRYVKGAPIVHIIFGYLQIGEIVDSQKKVSKWLLESHPHASYPQERWFKGNAIFVSEEKLSIKPELPGAGILNYRADRVLTKPGENTSIWQLPDFFRQIRISCHSNAWKGDNFQSVARGQEFVLEANAQVLEWVKKIISAQ